MEREIKIVKLSKPLNVAGQEVKTLELRKPLAGELRGVKLFELLQMDAGAVAQVVPRIVQNCAFGPGDFNLLEPKDLLAVTTEVVGFFVDAESLPA